MRKLYLKEVTCNAFAFMDPIILFKPSNLFPLHVFLLKKVVSELKEEDKYHTSTHLVVVKYCVISLLINRIVLN